VRTPSKTFAESSEAVITAVKAGASLREAAQSAGVSYRTVDRWLHRGRINPGTPGLGRFAAAIDATRQFQGVPGSDEVTIMHRAELRELAERAARNGSVSAMKLVKDFQDEDADAADAGKPDRLDELVARRNARLARERAAREATG
jgi:transposase